MPGFDRTGPRGSGPLTGGGRGVCVSGIDSRISGRPTPLEMDPRLPLLRFPRLGRRPGLRSVGRSGRGMPGTGRGRGRGRW